MIETKNLPKDVQEYIASLEAAKNAAEAALASGVVCRIKDGGYIEIKVGNAFPMSVAPDTAESLFTGAALPIVQTFVKANAAKARAIYNSPEQTAKRKANVAARKGKATVAVTPTTPERPIGELPHTH